MKTSTPLREENLTGWGLRDVAICRMATPERVEDIGEILEQVAREGGTIGPRGSGCSYGDASLNGGAAVLNLSRLNRILEWDAATGLLRVEPGVTISKLWRHMISSVSNKLFISVLVHSISSKVA